MVKIGIAFCDNIELYCLKDTFSLANILNPMNVILTKALSAVIIANFICFFDESIL